MLTTVVHVKDPGGFDIYIGRQMRNRPDLGVGLWGNPFKIEGGVTRDEAVTRYKNFVIRVPALIKQIPGLRGQRLGCWCAPQACHGDILAEYANNLGWLWSDVLAAVEDDRKHPERMIPAYEDPAEWDAHLYLREMAAESLRDHYTPMIETWSEGRVKVER